MKRIVCGMKLWAVMFLGASILLGGCKPEAETTPGNQPSAVDPGAVKDAVKEAVKEVTDDAAAKDAADAAAAKTAADTAAANAAAKDAADMALANKVKLPAELEMFQAELRKAGEQIATLRIAVGAFPESAAAELPARFATFKKELTATEALVKTLRKRGDDMKARGAAYFEKWEQQLASMETSSVKKIAEKRREELAEDYGAVIAATQLTGDAYQLLVTQLWEIRKPLSDTLSAESVKELTPQIEKATKQADTVKERVATIVERLAKIASIYAAS